MPRRSPPLVALAIALSAALDVACTASAQDPTPDTCTPAGGECARTDAPLGAQGPAQATCVDYGAWQRGRPYEHRDGFSCPEHVSCGTTPQFAPMPSGGGSHCRSAVQVCCFPTDAGW